MRKFKDAVLAADFEAVESLLAADVTFVSPVAFTPYQGRAITAAILRGVWRVFDDFRYEREIVDGRQSALVFRAQIGEVEVHGCDFITTADDGLITEFTVMVRPLRAAHALADAMRAEFDQIQAEATAATQEHR